MAFIISKPHQQPSLSSESDVHKQNQAKDGDDQVVVLQNDMITSQLYLKSSNSEAAAAALDRDLVLRRIRNHKNLRRVKTAFQVLMGNSSELQAKKASTTNGTSSWLDQEDSFSSP